MDRWAVDTTIKQVFDAIQFYLENPEDVLIQEFIFKKIEPTSHYPWFVHVGQEFPEALKMNIAFDIAIDLGIMKIYIWSPTMYYTGPAHRRSGLGFKYPYEPKA
uniref:Uncharacterized protein n=1 Tax=Acrobeloides nanus TaxID=290746 RepID=A0A914CZR7_9BILA